MADGNGGSPCGGLDFDEMAEMDWEWKPTSRYRKRPFVYALPGRRRQAINQQWEGMGLCAPYNAKVDQTYGCVPFRDARGAFELILEGGVAGGDLLLAKGETFQVLGTSGLGESAALAGLAAFNGGNLGDADTSAYEGGALAQEEGQVFRWYGLMLMPERLCGVSSDVPATAEEVHDEWMDGYESRIAAAIMENTVVTVKLLNVNLNYNLRTPSEWTPMGGAVGQDNGQIGQPIAGRFVRFNDELISGAAQRKNNALVTFTTQNPLRFGNDSSFETQSNLLSRWRLVAVGELEINDQCQPKWCDDKLIKRAKHEIKMELSPQYAAAIAAQKARSQQLAAMLEQVFKVTGRAMPPDWRNIVVQALQ